MPVRAEYPIRVELAASIAPGYRAMNLYPGVVRCRQVGRGVDVHPIDQMHYQLTMLAYDMNGEPLSFGHGAPLRLRNETQLGFKQVKWVKGIEFVAHYSEVGGGYGGYNQDHEFFGYRQSI